MLSLFLTLLVNSVSNWLASLATHGITPSTNKHFYNKNETVLLWFYFISSFMNLNRWLRQQITVDRSLKAVTKKRFII